MLVRSSAIDVVVIDSVAALVPKAEIQGEMGDSHIGLQARLMSQALRKLAGAINNPIPQQFLLISFVKRLELCLVIRSNYRWTSIKILFLNAIGRKKGRKYKVW